MLPIIYEFKGLRGNLNNVNREYQIGGFRNMSMDNSIFIGGKPFMNYVTGVVMQFTTKNAEEVTIKARGKFISRAVDVAEVTSKRFLDGTIEVKEISINSEEFQNKEGKDVRVSTIDIRLRRK